jgi:hypothetical protein
MDGRNEIFLQLITTSAKALGTAATPTLAKTCQDLLDLLSNGSTTPPKEPRESSNSTKEPIPKELLARLKKLLRSGAFVKTTRKHAMSANSIRSAILSGLATPHMQKKFASMFDLQEVKADGSEETNEMFTRESAFADFAKAQSISLTEDLHG